MYHDIVGVKMADGEESRVASGQEYTVKGGFKRRTTQVGQEYEHTA